MFTGHSSWWKLNPLINRTGFLIVVICFSPLFYSDMPFLIVLKPRIITIVNLFSKWYQQNGKEFSKWKFKWRSMGNQGLQFTCSSTSIEIPQVGSDQWSSAVIIADVLDHFLYYVHLFCWETLVNDCLVQSVDGSCISYVLYSPSWWLRNTFQNLPA